MVSMEEVTKQAAEFAQKLDQIRTVARKYLIPKEKSEFAKDPKTMGDASAAVEVVVSLMNLFNAAKNFNYLNGSMSYADLLFNLNGNPFWVKHVAYLMPLLQVSHNCMQDYHQYVLRPKIEGLAEKLEYHNKYACLDMFPAMVGLLYGYAIMRACSIEFKQELEQFIN